MTKVIAVLNQKGGSGKTTISTNVAYAISLKGHQVLLVDSDPQGSVRDWNATNKGELLPVVGLDRETLPTDLKSISKDFDYVVIDGAPQIAKLAVAAIKAADFILIPVQPSPYDIWATSDLIDVIKARQEVTNGFPKAAFVISRVIKNTKLSGEIAEALENYGLPILKSHTSQRVIYPTTAAEGKTVLCESQDNAAAQEILSMTREILEYIAL